MKRLKKFLKYLSIAYGNNKYHTKHGKYNEKYKKIRWYGCWQYLFKGRTKDFLSSFFSEEIDAYFLSK